jgi:hypothetical protein
LLDKVVCSESSAKKMAAISTAIWADCPSPCVNGLNEKTGLGRAKPHFAGSQSIKKQAIIRLNH